MSEFRAVPGYEDRYAVSACGRVWSNYLRRDMRQHVTHEGYRTVKLSDGRKTRNMRVHYLVLLAHVGPRPKGQVIRHLNGDPSDNRLDNLAYGTPRENWDDAVRHGSDDHVGSRNPRARLTETEIKEIKSSSQSSRELAIRFGITHHHVKNIRNGHRWKHVA